MKFMIGRKLVGLEVVEAAEKFRELTGYYPRTVYLSPQVFIAIGKPMEICITGESGSLENKRSVTVYASDRLAWREMDFQPIREPVVYEGERHVPSQSDEREVGKGRRES